MKDDADTGSRNSRTISRLIGDGARVLPEKSHGWFRDWFRKVWKVRGGGLYALGFAVSFIYFEIGSLGEDILAAGNLFNGNAVNFLIDILVDSFMNTIQAFIWPVHVVRLAPPWGAIGLGIGFVVFTSVLKPPIERWLFPDDDAQAGKE
ncbi:MAG: hypothetical protein KJO46_00595 [Gammaproteobacteria bacterium]|nr:hypothetical protein [Gammaproteobacteria bacterium]